MAFRFVAWLRGLGLLLGVEFGLGIWLSAYGTFPDSTSLVRAATDRADPVLILHLALAAVLLVLAFAVAVRSFGSDAPPHLRWYVVGLFGALLAAYECGSEFVLSNYNNNAFSLGMLVGFVAAAAFDGLGQRYLIRTAIPPETPTVTA